MLTKQWMGDDDEDDDGGANGGTGGTLTVGAVMRGCERE